MTGVSASSMMRVQRVGRIDGGVDNQREAHLGVEAAVVEGRERRASEEDIGSAWRRPAVDLRQHQPSGVHVAAGDMGVDVDAARHDDLAGEVVGVVGAAILRRSDNAFVRRSTDRGPRPSRSAGRRCVRPSA